MGYPAAEHFCIDSDLYSWQFAQNEEAVGTLYVVRSPYAAIKLCECGYNAVAFMADVPGHNQILQLYEAWQNTDAQIVCSYEDSEQPESIGSVIKALADLPLMVLPYP